MSDLPYRPPRTRVLRNAYRGLVPKTIEAYAGLTMDSVLTDMEQDLRVPKHRLWQDYDVTVVHAPNRRVFQGFFERKAAHPPEIRTDAATEREYLVGVGLPGREELHLVEDEFSYWDSIAGRRVVERLELTQDIYPDDVLFVYTEVSAAELANAHDLVHAMPGWVCEGLSRYFRITPDHLYGLVLATPGYLPENYTAIAHHALSHASA